MTASSSNLARLVARAGRLAEELKRREQARAAEARAGLFRKAVSGERGAFYAFVRYAWPCVEPGRPFLDNWHIEVVCSEIEDWIAAPPGARLALSQPPRTMKSYLLNVMAPAFIWLQTPEACFITISNVGDLATRDSLRMRQVITHPDYRALVAEMANRGVPSWALSREQSAKVNFQIAREKDRTPLGSRLCFGVGDAITGQGADYLIVDDAYDAKQAIQGDIARIGERMAEVVSLFDQVWSSRFNPGGPKKAAAVMQRLHEVDIVGVAKSRGWHSVTLRMRAEADDPERHPRDTRAPGEQLVPDDWLPVVPLPAWEAQLGDQASGQLQQRPVARGGGMFPPDGWMWLDRSAFPTRFEREAMGWDLAFGASDGGAYHVGIHGGLLKGRIYHGGEVRLRAEVSDLMTAMRAARERWPRATGWYVEKRASAAAVLDLLRREIPGMVPREPDGDKVARAQVWQPSHAAGSLVLPCRCGVTELHRHPNLTTAPGEPWAVDFAREHEGFPRGQFKDRVDAEGYLVRELLLKQADAFTGAPGGYVAPSMWDAPG